MLFYLFYLLRYGAFLLSYVSNSNSFPKPLSPKEEERLLELSKQGDKDAKDELIEHNLRLVAHIAKKYSQSFGIDADDLISVGTIGLIKAVNSFNGTKSARLSSYASRCIENEMLMMMRQSKKTSKEISLNESLGGDKDGSEVALIDILSVDDEDVYDEVSLNLESKKVYDAIEKCLTDREKQIIILRYGLVSKEYTQREIAKKLDISRSYVSRIEKKALQKLNKFLEEK
ncbi:MAG: RNA polymerase sporulation sigma factor SigK [Clostridia bacterium]|nr:RNA polymerase sporulation sigma factor SigK [Clostridia bacterium]MBR6646724.1 RNA polymerase sporulation sigma factor SigK [Clostridia bacterium]